MTTPVKESTQRVRALQQVLLHELALGPRTTKKLTAALSNEDDQAVYRAMLGLEKEGRVTSFSDRRGSVTGTVGRVWTLADAPPAKPLLRDPLAAALFGEAP